MKLETPFQVKLGGMDGEGYRIAWGGWGMSKATAAGQPILEKSVGKLASSRPLLPFKVATLP